MNDQLAVAIGILLVNFPLVGLLVVGERRGWIAFGSTIAAKDEENGKLAAQFSEARATYAENVAYIEARRKEERDARIAAEKRVSMLTETTREITTLLQDVRVELARKVTG